VLISGAVVDAEGRPVAGALLVATRLHEAGKANVQTFAARSRPDGKFAIRHRAEGGPMPTGHLVVSVSREGLAPIEMVVAAPAIMFTVVLQEGAQAGR